MERVLVIAEHDRGRLKAGTGAAAGFARQLGGEAEILVLGAGLGSVAAGAARFGARAVLVADHPALENPLADRYAHVIAEVARRRGTTLVVAAASTFAKDILPRAAALADAAMASDVIGFATDETGLVFRRVMQAGNLVAAIRLAGPLRFVTVRASAFPAPEDAGRDSPCEAVPVDEGALPKLIALVGREERAAGRPDPTEARVVVSGGRALKNAADFERLVGGLADRLGAAVGSSRALVDAGITPNSLQVGQTGKIVAPDLYVAIGISGAVQHTAGMKDAKVIAAINKDPDAPIFEVADFGLVADIYEVVPELIARLGE